MENGEWRMENGEWRMENGGPVTYDFGYNFGCDFIIQVNSSFTGMLKLTWKDIRHTLTAARATLSICPRKMRMVRNCWITKMCL